MPTTATSTTINETLRKQQAALNAHDARAFASTYADNAEVFDPSYPDLLRGREAIAKDMEDFVTAFPDLELKIDRAIESGNAMAYEVTMRGTHKGPLLGPTGQIPPTNRRIEVTGGVLSRVDDSGHIVEERRYYNLAGLLEQIGLLQ